MQRTCLQPKPCKVQDPTLVSKGGCQIHWLKNLCILILVFVRIGPSKELSNILVKNIYIPIQIFVIEGGLVLS